MVRGMSWVIPPAQDAYGLSHEQLHFDITKLVVERFKKKIAAMKADLVIDLNSMIQYEYLESYREMNQLQNQSLASLSTTPKFLLQMAQLSLPILKKVSSSSC